MIIVFGSAKGGTGKTTLTVSTAVALKKLTNKSVCLLEADKQRSIKKWIDRRNEAGLSDIIDFKEAYGTNLKQTTMKLNEKYDFVVMDTAGWDGKDQRMALTFADVFISPVQPSQVDIDTLEDYTDIVRQGLTHNPNMRVIQVLNRCSTHIGDTDAKDVYDNLTSDDYWLPMAKQRIYDRKAHRNAFAEGMGIHEWRDNKAKAELELFLREAKIYG